jgi:hypothetical protein
VSARFWTAAEILRGLEDEFVADKRPRVCGLASCFVFLFPRSFKHQTSDIKSANGQPARLCAGIRRGEHQRPGGLVLPSTFCLSGAAHDFSSRLSIAESLDKVPL